jgi:hypothetical protein
MAGIFGYMAGGALQGTGEGMILEGKAKRAEVLKEIDARRRLEIEGIRQSGADARTDKAIAARDATSDKTIAANRENLELRLGADDARAERAASVAVENINLRARLDGEKVTRTEADAEGNIFGIRQDGTKVDLGIKGTPGGKTGEAPARVKEAEWAVAKGIFPDIETAYRATREKVGMSEEDIRTKGLAWVSAQKDRYGRAKFTTPEQQDAALQAYRKWVNGDSAGALESFKALEPKAAADEPGLIKSMFQSLGIGGGTAKPEPGAAAPAPAAPPAAPGPVPRVTPPATPGGRSSLPPLGTERTGTTAEGRPIIKNPDGSSSSERTITIQVDEINGGRPTNIPSMYGGKAVSEDEAIRRVIQAGGKDPETGRALPGYNTVDEAVAAAGARSQSLGRQGQGQPQASPYASPDAVRQAFRANQITREEAARILREQFGYK